MNQSTDNGAETPIDGTQSALRGFDPEFTDIVDYILRITYWIWEGHKPELCYEYYSEDCPVYTLAGYTEGAEQVTNNTRKTQDGFPDRTLHADNIVWGGDDSAGFHTSHLIRTNMTHLGDSEYGPPTGKHGEIHVIAHCVVKDNRVIEEWLVRDNYSLAEQLGVDPKSYAKELAQVPLDPDSVFAQWLKTEHARVSQINTHAPPYPVDSADLAPLEKLAAEAAYNIWHQQSTDACDQLYDKEAILHASARPDYEGSESIKHFYESILGSLPDARVSVDYLCSNSMCEGNHVALRWTLAGTHTGDARWGTATGAPILILGESQYRFVDGKVVEEWLVFDEVAVLTQIERARLISDKT